MTRIKICGIQTVADALFCAQAGADAIGLVFAQSSRRVDLERAREICTALPPFVSRIGIFVDATRETVEKTARYCGLNMLQFHGREDAPYCRSFAIPVLKAIRVYSSADLDGMDSFPAAALVLDAFHPTMAGGTGLTFNWELAKHVKEKPVILAGGLSPVNVAEAVAKVQPYAVDVSSGVETDGVKDREKIRAFIYAARRCA